jgi:pathogenesis-related protein 1
MAGHVMETWLRFRPFVGPSAGLFLGLILTASCTGSGGGGSGLGGAAGSGVGGSGGNGVGGGGGTDAGSSCTVDPNDPSALVRALSVEGGTLVEAPAPAPLGSHPSVTNGGCSQIAVERGRPFIVPFAFTDTDTPVGGCLVTVAGATNHIEVDTAHCDGGLGLAGDLPLHVTVAKDVCPGTFTLQYAAQADAPAISSYLPTVVTVSNAVAQTSEPLICLPPEPAPLTGITGAHNSYREIFGAPPLIWDDALTPSAQHIADVFAATAKLPPEYPGYGANLVAFGNPQVGPLEVTPADAVWGFIYPGDGCFTKNTPYPECCGSCGADAGDCMQYTQAVWAGSSRLGCAVASYSNAALGGDGQVWVCVYDPPGNQAGQSPY